MIELILLAVATALILAATLDLPHANNDDKFQDHAATGEKKRGLAKRHLG
jgi:hypothetical protein